MEVLPFLIFHCILPRNIVIQILLVFITKHSSPLVSFFYYTEITTVRNSLEQAKLFLGIRL